MMMDWIGGSDADDVDVYERDVYERDVYERGRV